MQTQVTHVLALAFVWAGFTAQARATPPPDSVEVARYLVMADTYLERNRIDSVWWAATQARLGAQKLNHALLTAWADQLIGLGRPADWPVLLL